MIKGMVRKKKVVVVVVMSAIIAMAYVPILENDFLENWDDQWMVLDNPYLVQADGINMKAVFTEPYGGQYSPINTLAYSLIIHISGMKASSFHLFSLVIHILNFILVGFVIEKLLSLIKKPEVGNNIRFFIAWGTAFLFGIHPMQVESVAWISASKIPLYSFFYLLGLWSYLWYKQKDKPIYLILTSFCFICSFLSKEQAVVFVLSLVAVDLVVHSKWKDKKIWLEKTPFLILALLFGGYTLWIQQGGLLSNTYPLYQRFIFANYSFWEYIIKLIVPLNLSHFYFFPIDIGEVLPLRFWFYPFVTIIFAWILYEYRQKLNKLYLFGGLFFLINIGLVLHIIPNSRGAIIADRYIYLSSIGFFLILLFALSKWLQNHRRSVQNVTIVAAGVYLLVLAGYTHHRAQAWKNMETINEDVRHVVEENMGDMDLLR